LAVPKHPIAVIAMVAFSMKKMKKWMKPTTHSVNSTLDLSDAVER